MSSLCWLYFPIGRSAEPFPLLVQHGHENVRSKVGGRGIKAAGGRASVKHPSYSSQVKTSGARIRLMRPTGLIFVEFIGRVEVVVAG